MRNLFIPSHSELGEKFHLLFNLDSCPAWVVWLSSFGNLSNQTIARLCAPAQARAPGGYIRSQTVCDSFTANDSPTVPGQVIHFGSPASVSLHSDENVRGTDLTTNPAHCIRCVLGA